MLIHFSHKCYSCLKSKLLIISFMSVYHEWNSLVKRRIRRPRNILKLFSGTTKHVGETTYGDSEQDVRETTRWQNDRSPIIYTTWKKGPKLSLSEKFRDCWTICKCTDFPKPLTKNYQEGVRNESPRLKIANSELIWPRYCFHSDGFIMLCFLAITFHLWLFEQGAYKLAGTATVWVWVHFEFKQGIFW